LPDLWIEFVSSQNLPQFLNVPSHDRDHIVMALLDVLDNLRELLLILKCLRARELNEVTERLNIHLLDDHDRRHFG
jgi:hypothetical protein